jgi:hypothetical protein
MFFRRATFLAVFIFLLISMEIRAQEPQLNLQEKTYEYGFSAGMLFPGDINISESSNDFEKKNSILLKGFIDSYLIPKLAVGLYLQYSSCKLEETDDDAYTKETISHDVSVFEIGGSFKPRFFIASRWTLKPGLNVGYRKFYFDFKGDCGLEFDNAEGMAVNGSVEIQYLYSSRFILFSEIGFITQPYGGKHDVTHLDFGPILYLNFGVAM